MFLTLKKLWKYFLYLFFQENQLLITIFLILLNFSWLKQIFLILFGTIILYFKSLNQIFQQVLQFYLQNSKYFAFLLQLVFWIFLLEQLTIKSYFQIMISKFKFVICLFPLQQPSLRNFFHLQQMKSPFQEDIMQVSFLVLDIFCPFRAQHTLKSRFQLLYLVIFAVAHKFE